MTSHNAYLPRHCGYAWDLARLRSHLLELSSAMSTEMELLAKLTPVGR
jgi:hypothetical protein